MAIHANGREYDITFKAGAQLKTTTSQFLVVGIAGGTTSSDRTVELCGQTNTVATPTAASFYAIGINQNYMSANSEICDVRMFGISKAKCASSIAAGDYVMPYYGVSTTTFAGHIVAVGDAVSISVATASICAHTTILGRALEAGSTNTVISVFVNPSMYDLNLIK